MGCMSHGQKPAAELQGQASGALKVALCKGSEQRLPLHHVLHCCLQHLLALPALHRLHAHTYKCQCFQPWWLYLLKLNRTEKPQTIRATSCLYGGSKPLSG